MNSSSHKRDLNPKSNHQNMEPSSSVVPEEFASTKPVLKTSRQRFKPQLSCTLCRSKKLKCDRGTPCDNCTKRNLAASCTFVHAAIVRGKPAPVQRSANGGHNPKDMHNRIRHLEELVVSLMQQHPSAAPYPVTLTAANSETNPAKPVSNISVPIKTTALDNTSSSLGLMTIENNQSNYIGGSHWAAILESISGLKESTDYKDLSNEDTEKCTEPKTSGPLLLVGAIRKATRAEILASIPTRSVVDRLISEILNDNASIPVPIHCDAFKREYEQFWMHPNDTPIMWIGLFYAVMCLAINKQILEGTASSPIFPALLDPQMTRDLFNEKTAQCLILGNYTEPSRYTVGTLLIYAWNEHCIDPEAQVGVWMIMGLVVRAGLRLGYHRDPSHYPKISAFQGENQRRLWLLILHMDIVLSCQVGLPRMLTEEMYDTKPPRNLLDSDFNEDTDVLPNSRPQDTLTPHGFLLLTHGVTETFAKIVDQTNSTTPTPYDEVMRLDRLLHETYSQIPNTMKLRSIEDLKSGPPDLIKGRFAADILFQKGRCVLHRKFLVPPKTSTTQQYLYSIKSCVDSAMAILKMQDYIWAETKSDDPLYEYKWKCTTMMAQDFLLAAMVICLHLSNSIDASNFESFVDLAQEQGKYPILWTKDEMIKALESSYRMWNASRNDSKRALKASRALKSILIKVRKTTTNQQSFAPLDITEYPFQNGSIVMQPLGDTGKSKSPNQNPVISPFAASTTSSSPWISDSSNSWKFISQPGNEYDSSYSVVDDIVNAPMEFDWDFFDTHLQQNHGHELAPSESWNSFANQDSNIISFPDLNPNPDS